MNINVYKLQITYLITKLYHLLRLKKAFAECGDQ